MNETTIIDEHDMTFDPGDPLNGSLYICVRRGDDSFEVAQLIEELRTAGLWSDVTPKQVADEHRQAYKEQLEFVEAIKYDADGCEVTIARYDHPKFPSDQARWNQWKDEFDARYKRA